jgi:hypothetical protein
MSQIMTHNRLQTIKLNLRQWTGADPYYIQEVVSMLTPRDDSPVTHCTETKTLKRNNTEFTKLEFAHIIFGGGGGIRKEHSNRIKNFSWIMIRSRDSSVGIATGYGLNGPGLITGSVRFFSFPQRPDRL